MGGAMQESLPASTELARRVRRSVLEMVNRAGSSHVGSALSIVDILVVLYRDVLRFDPSAPSRPDRDRFILSKGHAGCALYATLAEIGALPRELLQTYYQNGSILSGHVSHKGVPGVELSTGSLGHGLSVATGLALASHLDGASYRTFAVLSDGECDEGSTWEAVLFAPHHQLSRLTAIVDYNKVQSIDTTQATLDLEPFADNWRAFGWAVIEVDGHDHAALRAALRSQADAQPTCVIAHTVKGKGVSFMENTVLWHYRTPRGEELAAALREIDAGA